ncbi:MAG: dihydropteroate synthase [Verrucomicrobiales bacterium]
MTASEIDGALFLSRGRPIDCSRSLVMGIVNVNDDSFSGDGTLDFASAAEIAARQVADGADIIDVGAESARTNRGAISVSEEIRRLSGFIERFRLESARMKPRWRDQLFPTLLSVNTWRPEVIEEILPSSADILNDMGGLPDDRNARLCARHGAALVIMHTLGPPKQPRTDACYDDVGAELEHFFEQKIALAVGAGIHRGQIILDTGIGFAKQREDNLRVYFELERFGRFARPILLPASRKSVINDVLGVSDPCERDPATVACIVSGHLRGGSIFRVHNVRAAAESLRMMAAVGAREMGSLPSLNCAASGLRAKKEE